MNGLIVPLDDEVSLPDPGGRARSLRIDTHHHDPKSGVAVELSRLEAEPKVAASNFSMGFQRSGHPLDGCRGDHQHLSSQAEHHHADSAAGRVERHAAFAGAPQGKVKFDSRIDLAPANAAPCSPDKGHCAKGADRDSLHRADGAYERTGLHRCGFEPDGGGMGPVHSQKRHIGGGITAD